MDQFNREAGQPDIDARYRTMLVIWFAMLMTQGMFFFLTLFVPRPPSGEGDSVPVWILLMMALSSFALSFLIRSKLQSRAEAEQSPAAVQSGMIVALSLCEACSLFGLMTFFITSAKYYYLFF
ncbi:MAG TPA: hypothetical protein VGB17_00285, partial [Pyrinomonadaceae bacterium]